ncbi:RNA-directed DNA polymerase, eukaryota [Tanacetum coccineum]|uniref:RNA-directed DNA polymerase, eukaryota n=1 Tax=Tanacetum coccineum TaxID=301880 RepID=A0ABQ5C0K4_9ASTR
MDKSPGPDGFTFGFYRRYWSVLEKDVIEAVSYFFQHGSFPKGGNSSFIALIPKSQNANMVKDFRPISLIGSLYKIIAKIMANRLVGVLEDIVSDVQSAFVAVDFEKAFDSVRWDYLDEVLKKSGFGDRWCGWIHSCLRSSRGSILVNGSPTKEIQFHKGLKQGDPLSPFLFILIMKSLHLSFQNVVNAVLKCFFCASGLSINMHKSKLMGIAVDDGIVKTTTLIDIYRQSCHTQHRMLTILIFCNASDPVSLWHMFWEEMSDDVPRRLLKTLGILKIQRNEAEMKATVLIHKMLRMQQKSDPPMFRAAMPRPRYCFSAVIDDGTATTTITCFIPEAHDFVPDCNEVVNGIEDKDTHHVPDALKQVENTTHIFQYHFGK